MFDRLVTKRSHKKVHNFDLIQEIKEPFRQEKVEVFLQLEIRKKS